jgi:flagellin
MGLSINTNVAALNAYRNLSTTQNDLSKSLEKLSSGFRINRAADDAAGLAISEGMRSQIGGIKMGVRNAQDGISLVQTAEGALNETHSILQRMRDLSVQASNSGSLNSEAKANIQTEVDQLKSELTRIADTTKFNGQTLLDGKYTGKFQVGANAGEEISVNLKDDKGMSAKGLDVAGIDVTAVASDAKAATTTNAVAGTAGKVAVTGDFGTAATLEANIKGLNGTVTVGNKTLDLAQVAKTATSIADIQTAADNAFGSGKMTVAATGNASLDFTGSIPTSADGNAANASATEVAAASVGFQQASGASEAITKITSAIENVSTTRANLGAVQNRFEHTINNLNVAVENLSASESRIRDTDMAAEMVTFTRSQILSQAGTAMLAQAKSIPQGVLQLLQ